MRQNGLALQFASPRLQNDKQIVLAAVRQNGLALQFASASLQDDKEVVLAAVRQNGFALNSASSKLRQDQEVVLAALQQNNEAYEVASEKALKRILHYPYACVYSLSRLHAFKVSSSEHGLKGDLLKTKILLDFRLSLMNITDVEHLDSIIQRFQQSKDYHILKTGQGLVTRFFNLETSSLRAVNEISAEVKQEIQQKATPGLVV